jgi:hypothetical protein
MYMTCLLHCLLHGRSDDHSCTDLNACNIWCVIKYNHAYWYIFIHKHISGIYIKSVLNHIYFVHVLRNKIYNLCGEHGVFGPSEGTKRAAPGGSLLDQCSGQCGNGASVALCYGLLPGTGRPPSGTSTRRRLTPSTVLVGEMFSPAMFILMSLFDVLHTL